MRRKCSFCPITVINLQIFAVARFNKYHFYVFRHVLSFFSIRLRCLYILDLTSFENESDEPAAMKFMHTVTVISFKSQLCFPIFIKNLFLDSRKSTAPLFNILISVVVFYGFLSFLYKKFYYCYLL